VSLFQPAPAAYDRQDQQTMRNTMEARDQNTLKRDRHVELQDGVKIILRSANGTRYYLTVSDAGVLGTSAV